MPFVGPDPNLQHDLFIRQARPWLAGGVRMLGVDPVTSAATEYLGQRIEDPRGERPTDWGQVGLAAGISAIPWSIAATRAAMAARAAQGSVAEMAAKARLLSELSPADAVALERVGALPSAGTGTAGQWSASVGDALPPKPPFAVQTDPAAINATPYYHGTNVADLTPQRLDSSFTKENGLFGTGVYLTDSPEIAAGYARARAKREGAATLYQTNVNVKSVLPLEAPAPPAVKSALREAGASWLGKDLSEGEALASALKKKDATTEELWHALTEDLTQYSHDNRVPSYDFHETFLDLESRLRALGYDALTHTGGKRTGKSAHQVLIMLEPQSDPSRVTRMTPSPAASAAHSSTVGTGTLFPEAK